MTDIATLERRRAGHKGQLTKIQSTIDKHEDGTKLLSKEQMVGILKNLACMDTKTKEITDELFPLCITDDLLKKAVDEADELDMRIIETVSKLQVILTAFPDQSSMSAPCNTVKLPRMELPSFDGRYENWQSFQDLFIASIENNKALSGAQKLQYLKACVKGEAFNLIHSFTVTDTHYKEAWGLLSDRYDNKREITNSLLKRILHHPHVKVESATGLQQLLDVTTESMRSLKVLGRPVDEWDDIIVFTVVEKMDSDTRREWAMSLTGSDPPTFAQLQDFLDKHIRGLLAGSVKSSSAPRERDRRPAASSHFTTSSDSSCLICKQTHKLYQCEVFRALSVEERSNKVRNSGHCCNCLKSNHNARDCPSSSSCKKCGKRHNTLLHYENRRPGPRPQQPHQPVAASHFNALQQSSHQSVTLLKTALVKITDRSGNQLTCRAFLDDGSESSFISAECVSSLGLKKEKTNIQITGLSSSSIGSAKFKVNFNIQSLVHGASFNVDALVVTKVTAPMPRLPIDHKSFTHLHGLQLADPNFHEPGKIDILFGADIVASIMRPGMKNGPRNSPIAQNTVLGWVLSGRTSVKSTPEVTVHHTVLEDIMQRFWEVEELPSQRHFTIEEKACEHHFKVNHSRDPISGRYTVKLPFNDKLPNLGFSREQAERRLLSLERRFQKYPVYKDEYLKFMRDYESLGHMHIIPKDKINSSHGFYLPHHFVLKESSTTTKFRVVFDGSAKSSTGISLNQTLMVGPTIQDDLCTLLMRFRFHPIALKADIAKMYRQFKVTQADMEFQKILWRESPNKPISEYWLQTVTYGTGPAPFLATRALQQLGEDEATNYEQASVILRQDLYVDDLISGAGNASEAIQLHQDLVNLVGKAGMEMRKWMTNDPAVLQSIPQELRENKDTLELDDTIAVPALGVQWKPSSDTFTFSVNKMEHLGRITKRQLLSDLAKVFDPLGFLSPVTINAKLIFQELWKQQWNWDDELDSSLQDRWSNYQSQLTSIGDLQIPRFVSISNATSYQLHGFSDASERAYSAAVYLKSTANDGSVCVRLVTAKSKVAPVKHLSIPRLELCGAVLLSELLPIVMKACKLNCSVTAWTDSTLVLRWLAAFPGKWKTFIANRVAKIQEYSPNITWRHVRTEENPADCASRGIKAEELINHNLWWNGPKWLQTEEYPSSVLPQITSSTDLEEKAIKIGSFHTEIGESLITKFSSLTRLIRVVATIKRFCHNARRKSGNRNTNPFCPTELESSLQVLIAAVQAEHFSNEILALSSQKPISKKSKLLQLQVFIDSSGVLRVGGRLEHSKIPEEEKHPIVLPHNNHLTTLIIRQCHQDTLHGGFQLIQATLTRKYWILRGRDTIRHLVRKCVICRRHRAKLSEQLMGSLPTPRVTPNHPFSHCGVDYAGPYQVLKTKGRGAKSFKCYFAIFVCFSTKAIHLEYVTDLTSEAFIACYKRFAARRGIPSNIYSDCGTNFIGAEKEIAGAIESDPYNREVSTALSIHGTTWRYNAPLSPHHGGLWEAGVKSVKFHLRRVIGTTNLTLEEFGTLLCCVEGILNSRPLCAMSHDPTIFDALTPGHFLIGRPINSVPGQDLTDVKISKLSRWQIVQQISQHFWKRWRNEYLSTLQQRFKWTQKRSNLMKDDLVLIHDDQSPPSKWKLGRIVEVHPGADGLVRVVTVKTSTSEYKRPIVKLSPLLPSTDSN